MTGAEWHHPSSAPLSSVPLFPLPNVVLFPRAVLPLHIFEERYKAMTADALAAGRQVAMALLRPGWEKDYYARPEVEPVVCVGTILQHERLPDGKYNFLLRGHTRARVLQELSGPDAPYRLARLEPVPQTEVIEIDLSPERDRLLGLFDRGPLRWAPMGRQFAQLLHGPAPTADVADLLAFNFLDDVWLKQSLLAEGDVRRRVSRTVEALERAAPMPQEAAARARQGPSMN